jgi:S-layer protein
VENTLANSATAPVITTITDFTVGTDKITFKDTGTETFTATKINVNTATALFGGTVNALDLAATANGGTNAVITWFQYAGDTYIVEDRSAAATFTANDIVVKLSGLVDLSTLTVADFGFV